MGGPTLRGSRGVSFLRFATTRGESALDILQVAEVASAMVYWEPFVTDGALVRALARRPGPGPSHLVLSTHDALLAQTWELLSTTPNDLWEEVDLVADALAATDPEEAWGALRELWNSGEQTPPYLVLVRALSRRPLGQGPLETLKGKQPARSWRPSRSVFEDTVKALGRFAWRHVAGNPNLNVSPQKGWSIVVDPPPDAPAVVSRASIKKWIGQGATVVLPAQSAYGQVPSELPFVLAERVLTDLG